MITQTIDQKYEYTDCAAPAQVPAAFASAIDETTILLDMTRYLRVDWEWYMTGTCGSCGFQAERAVFDKNGAITFYADGKPVYTFDRKFRVHMHYEDLSQ